MTRTNEGTLSTVLAAELREHVRKWDTPPARSIELVDGGPQLRSPRGGVVVETCPDDVPPCARSVVDRARDRARELDASHVVTSNRTDLFLFAATPDPHPEDTDAPAYRYVDLREGLGDALAAGLDALGHADEHGTLPDQSARTRVDGVLRSVHAAVRPRYEALARKRYGEDEPFTRTFEAWATATGRDERDERDVTQKLERAAGRYAYLRTAEALVSDGTDRPVTGAADGLFGAFPESESVSERLSLAPSVARERLDRLPGDPLGAGHEELLPAAERTARGQFYTRPTLAAAACRWAIRPRGDDRPPRVLDPAAGSGTFLLAAAERLGAATDRARLDRLAAVDVDRLALHLASLNLVDRYGRDAADRPALHHGSFFDLAPGTGPDGEDGIGRFDAVVGNPPYIRQEDLSPDRDHFRAHLGAFGPDGATPYLDGAKQLSRRSDAYVYFVTHATRFLREGGRLAVVVPTKWLSTRYGEPFQEFLLDHHRVEAVVGFSARAFEDALVDTALLFVERCTDERERRTTTTNVVRVEEPVSAAELVATASADHDVPAGDHMTVQEGAAARTVAVDQGHLMDAGGEKRSPYLRAPAEFIRLLAHPLFTELGELADVSRGVTTGANDFFFLDAADRERWDVAGRFLTPAVKSLRGVDDRVVRAADAERHLLDLHDYVREVEAAGASDGAAATDRVKTALARDGYDGVLEYVEWGEAEGYHERRTCASRPVWFDLGALDPPAVLHPKFFDERVAVVRNPDGLVPGNAVDCVRLAPSVDERAMLGVLDSTVNGAMLECWGRAEGGGALQLMTYEVDTLPVLDVRALDADARERIAREHRRLVAGDAGARDDLDRAVLDAMDADLSVERLQALRDAMTRRRVRSTEDAELLVEPTPGPDQPGPNGAACADDDQG